MGQGLRKLKLVTLLAATAVIAAAVATTIAASGRIESAFVSAEALQAHAIELDPPIAQLLTSPVVTAEESERLARDAIGIELAPREVYRIVARALPGDAPRTAWLLLYDGGPSGRPMGPADGARTRTSILVYTGVLIDDKTGELLRWFQGGTHAEP
jgi:hypothetical protein